MTGSCLDGSRFCCGLVVGVLFALGGCGDPGAGPGSSEGDGDGSAVGGGGGGGGGTEGNGGSKDAGASKDSPVVTPPADTRPADRPRDNRPPGDLAAGSCRSNDDCAATDYCANYPQSWCKATDGACKLGLDVYCRAEDQGVCLPRHTSCSPERILACACDGKSYQNKCVAEMAGVNVANSNVPCEELKR